MFYRQNDNARRIAAMKGLPATRNVSCQVDVPESLVNHVYVDDAGKAWISFHNDTAIERDFGCTWKVGGVAVPLKVNEQGRDVFCDFSEPVTDPDSFLRELGERLPRERAEALVKSEEVSRLAAEKQEAERIERLANCTAFIELLEKNPSRWIRGEFKDGFKMHGDGYSVPDELKGRMKAVQIAAEERMAQIEKQKDDEMLAWIAEHGSDRLKKCIAEDIECGAAYFDERLEMERPGWTVYKDCEGESSDPRNPPLAAFEVLEAARKFDPQSELQYHVVNGEPAGPDDDGDWVEATEGWRGYTAEAMFLGKRITFGLPEEYWG